MLVYITPFIFITFLASFNLTSSSLASSNPKCVYTFMVTAKSPTIYNFPFAKSVIIDISISPVWFLPFSHLEKDNIRRYIMEGGRVIPGASTVHFDEISRKRIFASVDNANFSDIKLIRENYTSEQLQENRR